jgi:putative DNA primase/helicase
MTEHFRPVEGEQAEVREQGNAAHLISQRAADITPRHIDFLWPGRLALGKHTAFAGEPGDGKSQLSIYVAATISKGGKWPCDEGCAPVSGNTIIFNAEDGVDDTIVPRLMAAGANMERIHIVSAVLLQDGKGRRTFNLQADLALLERKIREIGNVVLVIIDPISSYMGKIDSHKNSEVRGALEPLSEMAERMRVAVLSITHFSKAGSGTTNKALHRFIGSIAFVGAPRAAFAVIEDADNEGRMLLLHAKNNMAPKPQGLAYRLLQVIVRNNIVASYVHWEDTPVTISADQALGAAENTGSRTMKDEATDFLRDTLGRDEVPVEDVQQAARKAGIAPKPLRVAREALKVRTRREGFGPGAVWKWSLPGGSIDALAPIDAHSRNPRASMEGVRHPSVTMRPQQGTMIGIQMSQRSTRARATLRCATATPWPDTRVP